MGVKTIIGGWVAYLYLVIGDAVEVTWLLLVKLSINLEDMLTIFWKMGNSSSSHYPYLLL